jgi:hypothetical protein
MRKVTIHQSVVVQDINKLLIALVQHWEEIVNNKTFLQTHKNKKATPSVYYLLIRIHSQT